MKSLFIIFATLLIFSLKCNCLYITGGLSSNLNGRQINKINSNIALQLAPNKKVVSAAPTVIPPNYNVALGFALVSGILTFGANNVAAGIPVGLIAALLLFQTGRVRFAFDAEALEVLVSKKGDELAKSRDNFVVGGRNRWKYSTVQKWFFIPSKDFPILVYFKENQTSDKGQIHFFPVIMDGRKLYDTMMSKIGPK